MMCMPTGATLIITHLNDIPVVAGQIITLASGQQVQLNANGTLTVYRRRRYRDAAFHLYRRRTGWETPTSGLVTINSVPCFVAGTLIRTPARRRAGRDAGPRRYGSDAWMTAPQPLRWIGSRTVPARGGLAPICIRAGTFGDHGKLLVSPQHRILVARQPGRADVWRGRGAGGRQGPCERSFGPACDRAAMSNMSTCCSTAIRS